MHKILASLLLSLAVCAHAQNTFKPQLNQFHTNFIKDRTSWDWRGMLTFEIDTDNSFGIKLLDVFESNYEPERDISQWRDQNHLDAYLFYKSPGLYNGFYIDSWYLSDNLESAKSQIAKHAAGYKLDYSPSRYVSFIPYVGYRKWENKTIIDYGWDTGLDASLIRYPLGSYYTDARLKLDYELYPEQQVSANLANIKIKKQFSALTSDSLALHFGMTNEKYYATNGVDLIQVDRKEKSLHNFLYYNVTPKSRFELITLLLERNVFDDSPVILDIDDIPNKRDVLRFENHFNFRYTRANFYALIGLRTNQETHDNADITTDSKALETSLVSTFVYRPTMADNINLQMSYVKYQYETPDTTINFDDRDAIRFMGQLNYIHRFSPLLSINLEFSAYLFHNMYIYQEQSANNNRLRIYQLGGSVKYQYNKFRNLLYTGVTANYTVYDFDDLFPETRSIIDREYVLADSLNIPLFDDFSLGFFGRLEHGDRGSYYEQNFTQLVIESWEKIYYNIFLEKQRFMRLTLDIGVEVHLHRGWRHLPEKRMDRDLSKVSPFIRVLYPFNPNIRLRGYFAITDLYDRGRGEQKYATGNLMLMYLF